MLWSPHVSTAFDMRYGGCTVIFVDNNKGWCAVADSTGIINFNDSLDGNPPKPLGDGKLPNNFTIFEVALSLVNDGSDDHMLINSGFDTVDDLFKAQFINKTKNFNINEIFELLNH